MSVIKLYCWNRYGQKCNEEKQFWSKNVALSTSLATLETKVSLAFHDTSVIGFILTLKHSRVIEVM